LPVVDPTAELETGADTQARVDDSATKPEFAEIEPKLAVEEGEGEESTISLAAMEAQLKPSVLAIFDAIAESHKKLHRHVGGSRRASADFRIGDSV
jgi:hypothetical protein